MALMKDLKAAELYGQLKILHLPRDPLLAAREVLSLLLRGEDIRAFENNMGNMYYVTMLR
jgi:hypothetical protein